MFVAIYNLFSTAPSGSRPAPAASSSPPASDGWLWPLGAAALIAGFVIYVRRLIKGGDKLNLALEPGLLALADGDGRRAIGVFREVAGRYPRGSNHAAVAQFNLVEALTRSGELDRAAEEAIALERGAGLLFGSDVRLGAGVDLARVFALRGELDLADRWIADV